jgi:hypothetical protein
MGFKLRWALLQAVLRAETRKFFGGLLRPFSDGK